MQIDKEQLFQTILDTLTPLGHVQSEDVPNIDLYMDQVTTFMEEQLSSTKRYEEDKILTKTMINNYAKNNLLPPPDKKKYSKEHQLLLVFIYYFKNILSIKDIEKLLRPITENYFHKDGEFSLTELYNEVWSLEPERKERLLKDLQDTYHTATASFENAPEDEQNYLQFFSIICSLSFDVYMKKLMIERLIDAIPEPDKKDPKEPKEKKENKEKKEK